MNKFYTYPKWLQWLIALLFFVLALALLTFSLVIFNKSIYTVFSFFIIIPISQLLATPLFTLLNLYQYLSPMLLVVNPTKEKYDIHNGTSFDYFFIMRKTKTGTQWRNKMLLYYIDGLLEIIRKIEQEEIPQTITIRGSSYFFSDRTAQRFGFELKKTGVFEIINLIFNYVDLCWAYSAAMGKIRFPNLSNVKTAYISGENLLRNKEKLESFKRRL